VLPLYVAEPDLWAQPDHSARQWGFVAESLRELREDLARLGQPLVVRMGAVTSVLEQLRRAGRLAALWSHEETGNGWTFARDRQVAEWCRSQGIDWHQMQNHGVVRRLSSRDGWANRWEGHMALAPPRPPTLPPVEVDPGTIPTACDLGLAPDICPDRQPGGRRAGLERLGSFLETRGQTYRRAMSSPLQGQEACSRLSPHLAWGTLSVREVTQATRLCQKTLPPAAKGWRSSLRSFSGRLHWHCHFIQKLEDEPCLEFKNLHHMYDGLRPDASASDHLAAWAQGETGYPFLDACMRSLRATGWLNFRMRAMVMSVASYQLWLDWRAPGLQLARMFTDYEPGIHWSQVQMQSGTTGINTVRIYNPVKQGYDQDPEGVFIRRWLPELAPLHDRDLHEPWRSDAGRALIGRVYPAPVFDHLTAARFARDRVWAVRRGPAFRAEAQRLQTKHGSRKSGIPFRGQRAKPAQPEQLSLPLGDL